MWASIASKPPPKPVKEEQPPLQEVQRPTCSSSEPTPAAPSAPASAPTLQRANPFPVQKLKAPAAAAVGGGEGEGWASPEINAGGGVAVVDSGAIIGGQRLESIGATLYTIPEV